MALYNTYLGLYATSMDRVERRHSVINERFDWIRAHPDAPADALKAAADAAGEAVSRNQSDLALGTAACKKLAPHFEALLGDPLFPQFYRYGQLRVREGLALPLADGTRRQVDLWTVVPRLSGGPLPNKP